jgi:hypothetical protein
MRAEGDHRADGRQHGPDVVHLVLEHVPAHSAVGQAVGQPVVQDQPGERRQPPEEGGERRVLPHEPQVGRPPEQEHQVEVAVADPW